MSFTTDVPSSASRELVTRRLFDFPREQLYAAFSDPVILAAWWGPQGFSNTFQAFDFRPGGIWRFVMHAPDGSDSEHECVFLELAAPERIVFRHLRAVHEYQATVTLAETREGTLLVWRMVFDSVEECERVKPFVLTANEQNLDRLHAYLEGVKTPRTQRMASS